MSPRRTVVSVVGTRPNLMKTVPVVRELRRRPDEFEHVLVHTGQHYDREMSEIFFEELDVGPPDRLLDVGAGSHATTTARVMERLEPLLLEVRPDLVLVPGDVNSTLAAALTAAKLGIPVGHIEAGLRSFDRTMPEEINRILTDQVSDLLFIHSPEAREHLQREGRSGDDILAVGNTMIDTLVAMRDRIRALDAPGRAGADPGRYLVVTLHRPALVDGPQLGDALRELATLAATGLDVIFPVHPRTRASIERQQFEARGVRLTDPLGYIEFLGLVEQAAGVLTDSGGIQEETTFLGVPCFTLRDNTERPVTVAVGTNTLLGLAPERISEIPDRLGERRNHHEVPPQWDGHAAERLVDELARRESYATFG
jgi:UDP-N-acetylglucosamine 2-epimerase (non-hydrolysing)